MSYDKYFNPFPVIETQRLYLKPFSMKYVNDLFKFCSLEQSCEFAEWTAHQNKTVTKDFVKYIIKGYKKGYATNWCIVDRIFGKTIGTCSFVNIDGSYSIAEIGYCISPYFWGNGYATEASLALASFGFYDIGFKRIQARIMTENTRSIRVAQKLGMAMEGILRKGASCKGESKDIYMYALTDEDFLKGRIDKTCRL